MDQITELKKSALKLRTVVSSIADSKSQPKLVYVLDKDGHIKQAIEVALATKRPLLLRGKPGTGKSTLAKFLAQEFGWRYYETVITSRTEARDLLYRIDNVQRLADAQASGLKDGEMYITPGDLWWAIDRESALERGFNPLNEDNDPSIFKCPDLPAIVLIDEIDKAEIDVPDGLLVPLGSLEFRVSHLSVNKNVGPKKGLEPLIIITTNNERKLSSAFMRRCICLTLPDPLTRVKESETDPLVEIAEKHYGKREDSLYKKIAEITRDLAGEAEKNRVQASSTAEYLDTVLACIELNINPDMNDKRWESLSRISLQKVQD